MPDYHASVQYPYLEGGHPELLLTNAPSGLTYFSRLGISYTLEETTTWTPRDPANIINAENFLSSVQEWLTLDNFRIGAAERGLEPVPITHHRRLTLDPPRRAMSNAEEAEYRYLHRTAFPERDLPMYARGNGMAAMNAALMQYEGAHEITFPNITVAPASSIVANFLPQTLTPAAKTAEELDKENWAKNGLF